MIAIIITTSICLTVIVIYALKKYWSWKNPYTDEKVDEITKGYYINDDRWIIEYRYWQVKRTYKNGTVTFLTIKMSR